MDKDTFTLNNQTYSNNNNILLGIINELHQIANSSHENLTIKRISDVIIKMNFIINENKKNMEIIMNQFTILKNQMNLLNQKININNINNQQELKLKNGRYVGQVVNGLREGKGIEYWEDGEKEKEFIIIMMVINMKVILEMIKEKEKEFIIIIMVIEKWVIIIMVKQ